MKAQGFRSAFMGQQLGVALIASVVWYFAFLPASVYADCLPNGTPGNDIIICTGSDADGVNGRAGNDQITVESGATITSPTDGIRDTNGNSTVENNGVISANNDGIELSGSGTRQVKNTNTIIANDEGIDVDGPGNSTIENSGTIIAGDHGISGAGRSDTVTNSGSIIAGDNGISAEGDNDVITNTGEIIAGDDGINAGHGDDTIFQSGTIHAGGSAIDAGKGNDQVTIVIGSEITGRINGEDDIDTLIFQLTGDQATLDAFNTYIATNGINASTGHLTFGGQSYRWVNFEQLQYLLILIATGNTTALENLSSGSAGLEELCSWPIKAFRLANGDLQVYSGFDVIVPDGFLVGVIILEELEQGITRFQDHGPRNPNWYVTVEYSPQQIRYLVVYNQHNRFVGHCEF